MKLGFFGTPEMAAYYLNRLSELHDIEFAVTGEDKPKGRHGTPTPCPAKEEAIKRNIPVFQPDSLLDENFLDTISELKTDAYVVAAYSKLIPPMIFNKPRFGMINVHPSLLPRYRGAAPMQWALINGESSTGISIQYISEGWDTGDILLERKIPLNENMTYGDLYDIVLPMGFDMLAEVLDQFASGNAEPVKQNNAEATYCGKLDRDIAHINWNNDSRKIHNLVRGLNPKPVAWTQFKDRNVKIYRTGLTYPEQDLSIKLEPGHLDVFNKKLYAGTGSGLLEIIDLQPESKKTMNAGSFINGYRIERGNFFQTT